MKLPNIPYFYVIKEVSTGLLYAGSKSSNNANPDLLWNPNHKYGYFTSSKIVHQRIKDNGYDSFEIVELKTDFRKEELNTFIIANPQLRHHALSFIYETKYLQDNNCAENPKYLNMHNNTGAVPDFSHPKTKAKHFARYGVENPSQSSEIKNAKIATSISNYGVPCPIQQHPEIKEKAMNTMINKYGVSNLFNLPEIQEQIKQECLTKYGVRDHSSRPEIAKKISDSHTGKIKTEAHRKNIGLARKDKVRALDTRDNTIKIVSKLEFDSNEFLIGDTTGRIPVKDSKGNGSLVYPDDPRYISGELRHVTTGYTTYVDENNNPVWLHFSEAMKLGFKKRKIIRGNRIHNPETLEIKVLLKGTPEFEEKLKEGWVIGGIKNSKYKKRHMKKDGVSIQVALHEVDNYLKDGWDIGRVVHWKIFK